MKTNHQMKLFICCVNGLIQIDGCKSQHRLHFEPAQQLNDNWLYGEYWVTWGVWKNEE